MYPALATAAEKLVDEFPDEPTTTVIRVLTACADEFPDSDLMFVEQAARARLNRNGWRPVGDLWGRRRDLWP